MKFYSIRVAFVLQVVWMIMMSSCEKNQNVYSQPTDIPDNPSSVDVLSDKYASREITLELKENVRIRMDAFIFRLLQGKSLVKVLRMQQIVANGILLLIR